MTKRWFLMVLMVVGCGDAQQSLPVVPHCENRVRDKLAGETDIDCGGSCRGCQDGQPCASDTDCLSQVCRPLCQDESCSGELLCVPAHCGNDAQDQDEADVDCGGVDCYACHIGQRCVTLFDCISQSCHAGLCQPRS